MLCLECALQPFGQNRYYMCRWGQAVRGFLAQRHLPQRKGHIMAKTVELRELTATERKVARGQVKACFATHSLPWAWGWYASGNKPGLGDMVIAKLFPQVSTLRANRIAAELRGKFIAMLPAGVKNGDNATWATHQNELQSDKLVDSYVDAIVTATCLDIATQGEPSAKAGKGAKAKAASEVALAAKLADVDRG